MVTIVDKKKKKKVQDLSKVPKSKIGILPIGSPERGFFLDGKKVSQRDFLRLRDAVRRKQEVEEEPQLPETEDKKGFIKKTIDRAKDFLREDQEQRGIGEVFKEAAGAAFAPIPTKAGGEISQLEALSVLPGGPLARGAKTAATTGASIGKFLKKNAGQDVLSKTRVQNAFKITDAQYTALVKRFENKKIDEILREIARKPPKSFWKGLSRTQKLVVGGSIFGSLQFGGIGLWYAADNVGSMGSIQVRDVTNNVKFGGDPQDALEVIDFWESAVESSKAAIVGFAAVTLNPIIWAAGLYFLKSANDNLFGIRTQKELVLSIQLQQGQETQQEDTRGQNIEAAAERFERG